MRQKKVEIRQSFKGDLTVGLVRELIEFAPDDATFRVVIYNGALMDNDPKVVLEWTE